MNERIRHATQRLRTVIRGHADASAMLGAGAVVLMVILAGAAILRSSSIGPERIVTARPIPIAAAPSPSVAGLAPSPSLAVATPLGTPSAAPTGLPTAEPTEASGYLDEPDQDPIDVDDPDPVVPTPTPEPTRRPRPSVALLLDGTARQGIAIRSGDSVDAVLGLRTKDLDASACTITQAYEPDDPAIAKAWTKRLRPKADQTVTLTDGTHTFTATRPSAIGKLRKTLAVIAMDGKPEACRDFEFSRDPITAASFDELGSEMIGTWTGCVATPWTPMYSVTVRFDADGTYSAASDEVLDGTEMTALYYGMDEDSSKKRYALTDLQASGLGLGEIDVVFGVGTTVRDELRNVRLMGDKLEFEMFHFGEYGPLTFQLHRPDPSTAS